MIKLFKIYITTIIISVVCWWAFIKDLKDIIAELGYGDVKQINSNHKKFNRTGIITCVFLCICPILNIIFDAILLLERKDIAEKILNDTSN